MRRRVLILAVTAISAFFSGEALAQAGTGACRASEQAVARAEGFGGAVCGDGVCHPRETRPKSQQCCEADCGYSCSPR